VDSRVRVSIGNLAWHFKMEEGIINTNFGILNPKNLEKGEHSYMALGGAAMITEKGKQLLENIFGASNFERDEKSGFFDARFEVGVEYLEWALKLFADVESEIADHERDRTLDIMAELSRKVFPGYQSILTESEVKLVRADFVRVVRQKLPATGADTSARGIAAKVPTHRLFRIHTLVMPRYLVSHMFGCPVVKVLSEEELKTTDGGSKMGQTREGRPIQNNLFWVPPAS
jgi:hypothetical protein